MKIEQRTYLAIDYGTQRIGIASAQEPTRFPAPLIVIEASGKEAEKRVLALIAERCPNVIVVGLPLNDDNSEGPQATKVRKFCERLSKRVTAEIVLVDEYGTSYEVDNLLAFKKSKSKDKAIDAYSAVMILESYFKNSL